MTGKSGAHFYVSKTGRRRSVAGTHRLHGLALAAIWRAPKRPKFLAANCVTGIPEFGGDAAVAGIF